MFHIIISVLDPGTPDGTEYGPQDVYVDGVGGGGGDDDLDDRMTGWAWRKAGQEQRG